VSVAYSLDLGQLVANYNAALLASHALDFGDLIELVARLFRRHPEALARWQAKFRWIQVDEVKDTNPEEYAIIAQFAAPHRNLAFFGDVEQTLYEWRGSSPDPMLRQFRYQLGGQAALDLLARHEEEFVEPKGDVIRAFLPKDRPCLMGLKPGFVTPGATFRD
jgi:ATP-dependent exoDNAse (exonuclease V) beta subunit